ncbi:MAG: GNAT family N-acetyltransferase [Bacteroidia bacterium]|jgi:GNAT superfamily N-acetyltransferase
MEIQFRINEKLNARDVIDVFKSSGINRPVEDVKRIQTMLDNSNLIISAWNGSELIALARAVTDFTYCCYLSDIAVKKEHQKFGIGRTLIELTQEAIGEDTMLIFLSNMTALEFHPKEGFEKVENGYIIKRKAKR